MLLWWILGRVLSVLLALAAVFAVLVNCGFRIGYVYIDHEVFKGFAELLFYIMVVNAVYSIGVAAAVLAKKHIPVIIIILSCGSFILTFLFWVLNYVISTQAYVETARIVIGNSLPFIAALFGIPFLLLCFPDLKIPVRAHSIIAVVLAVFFVGAMAAVAIAKIPPLVFKFDAQPVVFDIGTGKYSVVFATNADAQAWVTYTYNGALKTVYANEAGYKAIGRIHAVKIPRDELDGNQYTVHATRVLERLAYGGRLGTSIATKTYTLKDTTNVAEPKIIAASDWHSRLSLLDSAAAYFRQDADLVIFNGDYADFYVNEQQIIDYFLRGAFMVTGGEVPGIFVRGNHEVRGSEKVEDWGRKIGLTDMYYQVRRGNNLLTVFDTAESEDSDQWEHDGFYDMVPYLTEQVEWFGTLPVPDTLVNNIVVMHDPGFTSTHDEPHAALVRRFKNTANAFNVDFSLSGHSHAWRINMPDPVNFNFYRIEGGGRNGGDAVKTLADLTLLRAMGQNRILHTLLNYIVLERKAESYRLSLIRVGNSRISIEGVTDSGNRSLNVLVR